MVGVSLKIILLTNCFPLLKFFINSHDHIHPSKTVLQKENTIILLKQGFLSWSIPLDPPPIGLRLLTLVYWINWMPIVEIPKISPYEALFHVALNYTSLRILGCACYPWLHPYWSHKLELKSIKCVFVGYSLQHKGYGSWIHRFTKNWHLDFCSLWAPLNVVG